MKSSQKQSRTPAPVRLALFLRPQPAYRLRAAGQWPGVETGHKAQAKSLTRLTLLPRVRPGHPHSAWPLSLKLQTMKTIPTLAVNGFSIRQRDGILYCLNDLHSASGGKPRHKPGMFIRRAEVKEFVSESADTLRSIRGANGGIYACRELALAYAAWISSSFHLHVLRAFLNAASPSGAHSEPVSIDPLDHQALTEAFESAHEWMNGVRKWAGIHRNELPPDGFPEMSDINPKILTGLVARALFSSTFTVAFDDGMRIDVMDENDFIINTRTDDADSIAFLFERDRCPEIVMAFAKQMKGAKP